MAEPERRRPASVYGSGSEPDVRFSLANERTFLAWIRTSLALTAGGVALESLGLNIHPGFRLAASIVLIGFGIATPVVAWFGWMRVERAMRLARPLPASPLGLMLAAAVAIVGVLVLLGIFLK